MKKFFKMLALMFIIIPCVMFFVACTGTGDPDGNDPSKNPGGSGGNGGGDDSTLPGQVELTTETKTSILTAFKTATAAYNASAYQTMYTRMNNTMGMTMNGEPMEMGEGSDEGLYLVKTTINNSTHEAAQRTFKLANAEDQIGAMESADFIVKEGENYIEYTVHSPITPENGEYYESQKEYFISLGLVPEDYTGDLISYSANYTDQYAAGLLFGTDDYASFNNEENGTNLSTPFIGINSIDTFDDLVEHFEYFMGMVFSADGLGEMLGIEDVTISLTPVVTNVDNVYTLIFSCELEDVEGAMEMGEGMPALPMVYDMDFEVSLSFSSTELKSHDATFIINGLGEMEAAPGVSVDFGIELGLNNSTTLDTTAAAHNSVMMTPAEKTAATNYFTATEESIEQGYTGYYVIIPELGNYMKSNSIEIGSSLEYVTDDVLWYITGDGTLYDLITITWYTDEACQTLADPELIVTSKGIRLYGTIEVAEGYALINEFNPDPSLTYQYTDEPGRNFNMFTLIDVTSVTQFTVNYETYFENACYNKDDYTFEYTSVKIDGMTQVDNYTFELESQGIYIIEYTGTITYNDSYEE